MKITWKGIWMKGEVTIETETPEELLDALNKLTSVSEIEEPLEEEIKKSDDVEIPEISGSIGCSEAIRTILQSPWGRKEPRTMKEITDVLKTNALYFTDGSVSGVLTNMVKRGELRRIKKEGKWAYIHPK
ncbi:MAG: hypothetical protein ACE5K4_04950 [Candidatus Hydrothermarchaeota archaeon]